MAAMPTAPRVSSPNWPYMQKPPPVVAPLRRPGGRVGRVREGTSAATTLPPARDASSALAVPQPPQHPLPPSGSSASSFSDGSSPHTPTARRPTPSSSTGVSRHRAAVPRSEGKSARAMKEAYSAGPRPPRPFSRQKQGSDSVRPGAAHASGGQQQIGGGIASAPPGAGGGHWLSDMERLLGDKVRENEALQRERRQLQQQVKALLTTGPIAAGNGATATMVTATTVAATVPPTSTPAARTAHDTDAPDAQFLWDRVAQLEKEAAASAQSAAAMEMENGKLRSQVTELEADAKLLREGVEAVTRQQSEREDEVVKQALAIRQQYAAKVADLDVQLVSSL